MTQEDVCDVCGRLEDLTLFLLFSKNSCLQRAAEDEKKWYYCLGSIGIDAYNLLASPGS